MVIIDARTAEGRAEALDRAAAELIAGWPVIVPTDTVYGIAALPGSVRASTALFEMKGRPDDLPIAILVSDIDQARALSQGFSEDCQEMVRRGWPGPLTVVVHRHPAVSLEIGARDSTVGLRCPDHSFLRDLARLVGPLATTSANRHGEPTPADVKDVVRLFPGVRVAIDGGECGSAPSTVVDCTRPQPTIIRQGAFRAEAAVPPVATGVELS